LEIDFKDSSVNVDVFQERLINRKLLQFSHKFFTPFAVTFSQSSKLMCRKDFPKKEERESKPISEIKVFPKSIYLR